MTQDTTGTPFEAYAKAGDSAPSASPAARTLGRAPTFREQLDCVREDFQRRLEPMLEAAGDAAESMSMMLDPATQMQLIDEALGEQQQRPPTQVGAPVEPPAPTTQAPPTVQEPATADARTPRRGIALINPEKVLLRDKLAFVLGVTNVALTAFWIGRWPTTYHYFWLFKDIVLFSLRYLIYRTKGMHYMMLEYCYAANLVSFYYLFRAPSSAVLRKFCFAIMSGPLLWSIVAMRNSLVFHDGDKITTLMMHASPALSAWCMRWHPRPEWTAGMTPEQLAAFNSASWVEMALVPAALNVVWVALYYLLIFVLVNRRIQDRGYQNMFTAMVMRPTARKSPLARLVLAAPERLQPLVYLGMHTCASWLSLLPTKLWFDSFWAHTAILIGILLWSCWNGANFYFKVFAKKQMKELMEKNGESAIKKQT